MIIRGLVRFVICVGRNKVNGLRLFHLVTFGTFLRLCNSTESLDYGTVYETYFSKLNIYIII